MARKVGLGIDVLTAANDRIGWTFDRFDRVYVSFSGGKDSTVMLHLVAEEARRRGRKIGVLFVDLEAQYQLTIEHVENCYDLYSDVIDPYWVSIPLILRNAVSQFEPRWICWDPERRMDWVRDPSKKSIVDPMFAPFFRPGMEFEEFVSAFGDWYAGDAAAACFVGIRADESLNRYRTLVMRKARVDDRPWTTWATPRVANVYPIYDWKTADIWTFHAKTGAAHNRVYDLMRQAGLTIDQMRICQPYGDDQRKGLWLYQVLEPETWARIVARVNGANSGSLYSQERGSINGTIKVGKPEHHTWESYAELLLGSMPPHMSDHYRDKVAVFLRWWEDRGYGRTGIPDEADPADEAARKTPSWRRVCKALLRNDYWCKGLSFSQTKSSGYEKYRKVMKARRARWGIYA